ncbi:MAG: ATP synthase subunit I [Desulfobacterales bacterium]|nr:MAG: ATP synthase subunit I [Desulfobacterales bacterium]
MMESVRETQKKYCSRAMTAAILIGFGLILAGQTPMGKGVILGTLFSVINFILIGETLPLKLGKSKEKTFFLSLGSVMVRNLLMAVPLILALKFDQFNLFATIGGLFLVQLMILADHLLSRISQTQKSQI